MKILIASDSFKDSLSALEVCQAIKEGFESSQRSVEIKCLPMSDGGEGMLQILAKCLDLQIDTMSSQDPLGREIDGEVAYSISKNLGIVELAECSGLQLLKDIERNPLETSTFGTGLQIRYLLNKDIQNIVLTIGGSATNDGGTGIASALGVLFMNKDDNPISVCGQNLKEIDHIDISKKPDFNLLTLADVQNPLLGTQGATMVYARQKGANEEDLQVLETGLKHLSELIQKELGTYTLQLPGGGAAGGVGYGMHAFFDASIESGIDFLLKNTYIEEAFSSADLIISGEGKIDNQTMNGKVILGICEKAKSLGKSVVLFCGEHQEDQLKENFECIKNIYPIKTPEMTLDYAVKHCYSLLKLKATEVIKEYI